MTLKEEIKKYAKGFDWMNGGRFEALAMELGYKPSNASRRCRELVNEGIFERRLNERRCVEYRYFPTPKSPQEKEKERQEMLKFSMM